MLKLRRMKTLNRIAILLMAGTSNRFSKQGTPEKQFIEVKGIPSFIYPLKSLISSSIFQKIIVVCASGKIECVSNLIKKFTTIDSIAVIDGGNDRNSSVKSALDFIEQNYCNWIDSDSYVFIHDAARPCLPIDILTAINEQCGKYDAIAPAIPLTDSITQNGNYIPRDNILRIQTPQAFNLKQIISIYKSSFDKESTDDFSKAIKAGLSTKLIEGSPLLYKITYPEDIYLLEKIL